VGKNFTAKKYLLLFVKMEGIFGLFLKADV
jgi:hypothetical protein